MMGEYLTAVAVQIDEILHEIVDYYVRYFRFVQEKLKDKRSPTDLVNKIAS